MKLRSFTYWCTVGLLFILPWENIITLPGIGTLSRTAGLAVAALWGLSIYRTGKLRRPSLFWALFVVFAFWNALSMFWTLDPHLTELRLRTYAQMAVLILIIWDLFTTTSRIRIGLQAYVLGAYIGAFSVLLNFLTQTGQFYQRFTASNFNPDDIGVILALGVPMAWLLIKESEDSSFKYPLILINLLYIPLAALAIVLSGTRTAVFGLVPGFLYIFFTLPRLNLMSKMILLLVCAGGMAILPSLLPTTITNQVPSLNRLSTTGSEISEGNLSGRIGVWTEGLEVLSEHPFTGIGSGAFEASSSQGKVAHNVFISVLVDVGIIGFTLFIITILIPWLLLPNQPNNEIGFWLAFLITWFIGAMALTWEPRKQTWVVLGLTVAAACRFAQEQADDGFVTNGLRSFFGKPASQLPNEQNLYRMSSS